MIGTDDPRTWSALVVGAVWAALALALAGIALGGEARAATPLGATIKATSFSVANGQEGEAFAKCGRGKRALGGGVVQSGPASGLAVQASGPLDATGFTSEAATGDVAKQWYAAILNASSPVRTTRTLKVFAICE